MRSLVTPGGVVVAAALLWVGMSRAATNAQKCEAAKLGAAGKYAACRLSAEQKAVLHVTAPDFTKCDASQLATWTKTEAKYGTACATTRDQASVQALLTTQANEVKSVLSGGCPADHFSAGFCWYLSAPGASCDATCAAVGSTCSSATVTYVGSGGTDPNCLAILTFLLGAANLNYQGSVDFCDDGAGCTANLSGGQWYGDRCAAPSTTCDDENIGGAQRVCACN